MTTYIDRPALRVLLFGDTRILGREEIGDAAMNLRSGLRLSTVHSLEIGTGYCANERG